MQGIDLGLSFGAGLAAAMNPCGFAVLPSYVSYLAGRGGGPVPDAPGRWTVRIALLGLKVGALMTLGFLTVFSVLGLAVSIVGQALYGVLPWLSAGTGALLVATGIWLLAGRTVEVDTSRVAGGIQAAIRGGGGQAMYLYGIVYAVASLGCALPVFLLLVAQSILYGSLAGGIADFLLYAAGMGLIATAVSVGATAAGSWIGVYMRTWKPVVSKVSAWVILGAGLYIVGYWLRILFQV